MFGDRRPSRCHQGLTLGCCFCTAPGLIFRFAVCALFCSFLDPAEGGLTLPAWLLFAVSAVRRQQGQHGLVSSLLSLPCCLGVAGWNSELLLPCCFNVFGWNSWVFQTVRPARCPSGVAPGLLFLCCLWAIVQDGFWLLFFVFC